ncbi:hypothetical protein [Craterilacuibacter sinensis]|uniref:hypothetical protein n=1 Tax=Craterilacuibacter sinensis TaxID=2686017 RepID=UPI001C7F99F6|nr:hypothetical protein [Craterilacuibacter sinensis]
MQTPEHPEYITLKNPSFIQTIKQVKLNINPSNVQVNTRKQAEIIFLAEYDINIIVICNISINVDNIFSSAEIMKINTIWLKTSTLYIYLSSPKSNNATIDLASPNSREL